ncbi:hypothetical protein RTP6_002353 [Batrachochytrium dendrobatidis]
MGNAIASHEVESISAVTPDELWYKKRLSFSGISRGGKSTPSFDIEANNIINSRIIDDTSPVEESSSEIASVSFSQGRRKPQHIRASNPETNHNPNSQTKLVNVEPNDTFLDIDIKEPTFVHPSQRKAKWTQQKPGSRNFIENTGVSKDSLLDEHLQQPKILNQPQQDCQLEFTDIGPSSQQTDVFKLPTIPKFGQLWATLCRESSQYESEASIEIPIFPNFESQQAKAVDMNPKPDTNNFPAEEKLSSSILSTHEMSSGRYINPVISAIKADKNYMKKNRSSCSLNSNGSCLSIRKTFGRLAESNASNRGSSTGSRISVNSVRSINYLASTENLLDSDTKSLPLDSKTHKPNTTSKSTEIYTNLTSPSDHFGNIKKSKHVSNQQHARSLAHAKEALTKTSSSILLQQNIEQLSSKGRKMQLETVKKVKEIVKFRMFKFNSTSTLFVESSMVNADLQDSLRCASIYLARSIKIKSTEKSSTTPDILSEKRHILSHQIQFYHRVPTEEEIFRFLECIFLSTEINAEHVIIMLIYIQRMISKTGIFLQPINWARVVIGSVILTLKVWDDHAVWNTDFCQIFPDVNVKDFNRLERFYIYSMKYDVSVKASVYARIYFELRDLVDARNRSWALHPLKKTETSKIMSPVKKYASSAQPPSEDASQVEEVHAFDKSQTNTILQTPDPSVRRSYSDYQFVPAKYPAFVL